MARKALKNKAALTPKFSTRGYNRCPICGRMHGYMEILTCAAAASGTLPAKARSLELSSRAGKLPL